MATHERYLSVYGRRKGCDHGYAACEPGNGRYDGTGMVTVKAGETAALTQEFAVKNVRQWDVVYESGTLIAQGMADGAFTVTVGAKRNPGGYRLIRSLTL